VKLLVGIVATITIAIFLATNSFAEDRTAFGAMYSDQGLFLPAIARERLPGAPKLRVTGISVPHHLLAADMIARGFWVAASNKYERVIILSPDHFNRSRRPFATTQRDFDTAFGRLENDRAATQALLENAVLFENSDLFEKEHGISALTPFVKYFFPDATIVPIAISYSASLADWDKALALVESLTGPGVLVVQSTDFSHYLSAEVARQRDQESLNIIAANDVEAVARLVQPVHLDSKAAQYMQMRLQGSTFKSHATVIGNRNSAHYGGAGIRTTSYIVTVYTDRWPTGSELRYADQEVVYFGGDTFLGRWLTTPLADKDVANAIVSEVKSLTGGAPLVVNLEGAVLDEPPEGISNDIHAMHAGLAVPIMTALNVKVAGLANNHSFDLGPAGYDESRRVLQRAGIKPLGHQEIVDVGPFRLIGLNFIGKVDYHGYPVVKGSDLEQLCRMKARPPLIALVHWGQEYTNVGGAHEYTAAETMQACGVSAIVGAHSHQAVSRIEAMQGGEYQITYSLGNLLFDQKAGRSSGALLELRAFQQGTYATRLIPVANLFELGASKLRMKQGLEIKTPGTTSVHSTED
jgi:poly-gamma-glutamate synthesis protein (capsule biosynthesis protein)